MGYEISRAGDLLAANAYPGRGIMVGKSKDGKSLAAAYFIMGRSANSRNRIFEACGDDVTIYPADASKVEDPSLIIYSPVRLLENRLIVTNGDQTDTIYDGLKEGKRFDEALESRTFEPDAPNFTPRISALLELCGSERYQMSILKAMDQDGHACARYTYAYQAESGLGHFIHTYMHDGNPLPTFSGEPERVEIPDTAESFAEELWQNLNADNRISLYVRYIRIADGVVTAVLKNRFHKTEA